MDATGKDANTQLLTTQEFSATSRLSVATIHRLKSQGKIPFFQPAGKGGRLLFPADAIERAADAAKHGSDTSSPVEERPRLPGPSPTWMGPTP
jgi:hypothetical protein